MRTTRNSNSNRPVPLELENRLIERIKLPTRIRAAQQFHPSYNFIERIECVYNTYICTKFKIFLEDSKWVKIQLFIGNLN